MVGAHHAAQVAAIQAEGCGKGGSQRQTGCERDELRQMHTGVGQQRQQRGRQQGKPDGGCRRRNVAPLPGDGLRLLVAGRKRQQQGRQCPECKAEPGQSAERFGAQLVPRNGKEEQQPGGQAQHQRPQAVAV